ncbi:prolin-rich transmembrane protein [Sideroxydans lithotrophicus]|uniref:Prolin-rich transmembrane protein n=1 Tax=Sideroxydans lithotrophicus (strain ES-1) TaxID=580332 RepID=D5CSW9_SIDLE|nr:prolin-rich transmembrane protein [Sideroxydans lithotrophicus]ADE12055.1 prolin-rich transmembrane protein [Sideroxydans lithotrophicus ES-1]
MNRAQTGWCVLAVVLLATVSLRAVARESDDATSVLKVNLAEGPKADPAPVAGLEKLGKRAQTEHKTVDIFKGKSWYVAPPKPKPVPPPPPPPPPPPTAPPMPYAYMGSYQGKDGRMIIFLTKGGQVYSVSPGDVLEGTYRVEGIASGQLVLIYLPLNIQQTINIGEAS